MGKNLMRARGVRPVARVLAPLTGVLLLASLGRALGDEAFQGSVSATLTTPGRGPRSIQYLRKGSWVRIADTDSAARDPINLVNLAKNQLTIVFPKDSTFVRIDSARSRTRLWEVPKSSQILASESPKPEAVAPRILATPAPLIEGADPFGSLRGDIRLPTRPAVPVLVKTGERKKIQGRLCRGYEIGFYGATISIWATNDAALFPFRLLQRDYSVRGFGIPAIEEEWSALVRNDSLFPLEVTFRAKPGAEEAVRFRVEKIERRKIEAADLFEVPAAYREIPAPAF